MKTSFFFVGIWILLITTPVWTQNDWPFISQNYRRTAYVQTEQKLKPPLEVVKTYPVWGEHLIKQNDMLIAANGGNQNTIFAFDLSTESLSWSFEVPIW